MTYSGKNLCFVVAGGENSHNMAWLGVVATKHAMLNVVNCVVYAGDIIIKWLLLAIPHVRAETLEHATFRFGLMAFGDHLEKHVNVHALVDVEEECDCFGFV